jgi:hypothetical protein
VFGERRGGESGDMDRMCCCQGEAFVKKVREKLIGKMEARKIFEENGSFYIRKEKTDYSRF